MLKPSKSFDRDQNQLLIMKFDQKLILLIIPLLLIFSSCKKDSASNSTEPGTCVINDLEQQVIDELNLQYAHPFNNANPVEVDNQLDPLIDYLGSAKFAGLGEATHGTAEFYQMKDKIFRALVMEKGFDAIIFELPWGNALVVNDFVTKGIGTAETSIDQTYFWVYDTQETRVLAQWIHDYNSGLANDQQILFVGCDPQGPDFNIERSIVRNFLETVQPEYVGTMNAHYAKLPNQDLFEYSNAEENIKTSNIEGTKAVHDYFVEQAETFVAQTSEYDYQVALMASHVIQQREILYRTGDFGHLRDSLMAVYSEWWQSILGENSQIAIWAHNFHVSYGVSGWMGDYLRKRHSEDYRNVGFSFGSGSFNAWLSGPGFEFLSGVQRQTISEIPCGTVNNLLTAVDGDQHYLIFDEQSSDSFDYFFNTHLFYSLGSGFNISHINSFTQNVALGNTFDALIHFDQTSESVLK